MGWLKKIQSLKSHVYNFVRLFIQLMSRDELLDKLQPVKDVLVIYWSTECNWLLPKTTDLYWLFTNLFWLYTDSNIDFQRLL